MTNPWLEIPRPETNLNVRRVDDNTPVDAFWAVDPANDYLFLVEGLSPDSAVSMPDLQEIRCAVTSISLNTVRLVLKLEDSADWELFFALCSDLVRAIAASGPERGLSAVSARLAKWRSFLRSGQDRILSGEQIRGLFGELTLLADKLAPMLGWRAAVAAWGGPFGATRDFAIAGAEIEAKAKLAGAGREVRISSEDQLGPPPGGAALFLRVATLAPAGDDPAGGGESLADLVRRIREAVAPDAETADAFENRLLAAGYADATAYEHAVFSVEADEAFRVGNGFPRILPESLPVGVRHVRYGLDLGVCEAFRAPENWIETN